MVSGVYYQCTASYSIREETTRSWGRIENGTFTGMMGQLEREDADFGTMSGPTPDRFRVMDHVTFGESYWYL
ncbi:hypothetical protein E2C01_033982 [Portunus trituberculatus]|uniref:Uncharacterized protein n=1 Tax=Portunus trituberculatus TaxID=210409 RepID=A0A5B7F486_PORTR|nr:hypothetical protein [Portunus trituberculatus]